MLTYIARPSTAMNRTSNSRLKEPGHFIISFNYLHIVLGNTYREWNTTLHKKYTLYENIHLPLI